MMKFDTVIPHLKKIRKMHKLRDTSLEFWLTSFFNRNQPFLLYREIQTRAAFLYMFFLFFLLWLSLYRVSVAFICNSVLNHMIPVLMMPAIF